MDSTHPIACILGSGFRECTLLCVLLYGGKRIVLHSEADFIQQLLVADLRPLLNIEYSKQTSEAPSEALPEQVDGNCDISDRTL